MFHKQSEFHLLEEYKKHFAVTKDTIFAYDHKIYTNNNLPKHLIVHEQTHHTQQDRDGLEYWVENYLNNPKYRLEQEIEAYKRQLESINDRNLRAKVWIESAKNLSSHLYGNIITYKEALKLIKI